jgi:hypothetical protein
MKTFCLSAKEVQLLKSSLLELQASVEKEHNNGPLDC